MTRQTPQARFFFSNSFSLSGRWMFTKGGSEVVCRETPQARFICIICSTRDGNSDKIANLAFARAQE